MAVLSIKDTPCSRECGCWNPFGVCRNFLECRHHKTDYETARRRAKKAKRRHTSQRLKS